MSKSIIFVFAACLLCDVQAADWSYSGDSGPNNWKKTFADCGGKKQSPIDIKDSQTKYKDDYPGLSLVGYDSESSPSAYSLTNNGHTAQLNVLSGTLSISGIGLKDTYNLAQFHMHWGSTDCQGSEHTVEGLHFPMELHLVHFNAKYSNISEALKHNDGLAVLGVFAQVDEDEHKTMDKLIKQLCSIKYADSSVTLQDTFKMADLLPANRKEFIRYEGSLTTPKCLEIVTWTVFREPMKISQTQLNALRALSHNKANEHHDKPLEDNFRPTLDLHSRTVYKTYKGITKPVLPKTCGAPSLNPSVLVYWVLAATVALKKSITLL